MNTTATEPKKIDLECCVCGQYAGKFVQHYNRDTGYGICGFCAAEQAGNETPENMEKLYGKGGVNYGRLQVTHMGRWFWVMATFKDNERGEREANAYMERTPGASLLLIAEGKIFIADEKDLGRTVPA